MGRGGILMSMGGNPLGRPYGVKSLEPLREGGGCHEGGVMGFFLKNDYDFKRVSDFFPGLRPGGLLGGAHPSGSAQEGERTTPYALSCFGPGREEGEEGISPS